MDYLAGNVQLVIAIFEVNMTYNISCFTHGSSYIAPYNYIYFYITVHTSITAHTIVISTKYNNSIAYSIEFNV